MSVSRIHEICNVYESGVGHGMQKDGKEPQYSDPELNEAWGIGYNAGIEIADEKAAKNQRGYRKYEFCKAVKCECILPVSEAHEIKGGCYFERPGDCIHTAKEFHHWLKGNGFKIVKAEEVG